MLAFTITRDMMGDAFLLIAITSKRHRGLLSVNGAIDDYIGGLFVLQKYITFLKIMILFVFIFF